MKLRVLAVVGLAIVFVEPAFAQQSPPCDGPQDACQQIINLAKQYDAAANSNDAKAVTPGALIGGTEVVLLVEDDDTVRATAAEMLTDRGYRVLQARDAGSAMAIIESGTPIDLLFTEVVLPGPFSAPDLARRAQQRLPGLRVLFTSGYTDNAIIHGGRLHSGVELLTKPFTQGELAQKLREVLAR